MFRKSSKGWLKHCDFMLWDLLSLQIAFVLAYMFRHGFVNPYKEQLYLNMACFLVFADLVVIFFYETLHGVLKRGWYKEFAITVKHAVLVVLLAVLYLFTVQDGINYSRSSLYMMGVFYALISYLVRMAWKSYLTSKMKNRGKRSLLIVSASDYVQQVIDNIKNQDYKMFHIAGVVITDRDAMGETFDEIPVVATKETAVDYVCKEWVDEVFIYQPREEAVAHDLIRGFEQTGVTVHLNMDGVAGSAGRKRLVEKVGNYLVLTISMNYMTQKEAFMKRTMDIIGGFVGCVITGILFLFLAPAIYIQSPGPIFFSQIRVGRNGKQFKIYKFRSMYMDAEERKKELMEQNRIKDGRMFKMEFDPRVIGNKILPNGERKTGIGEFIRKTSLDEFPQFLNVLLGQMSLVGTRPPLLSETELYEPHHRARLAVKPGITGMWQISGRSDITDFEEVVRLDTQYINEWSMGLDFKILFKTVMVVLKGKGSM